MSSAGFAQWVVKGYLYQDHDDDGLKFYIPFPIIYVISRQWEGVWNEKAQSRAEFHLQQDSNPGPGEMKSAALTTRQSARLYTKIILMIAGSDAERPIMIFLNINGTEIQQ